MDNKAIAGLLYETADLLEIDGQDSFRVRSYRNAAEAIEALPQQVADLIPEPKKLLEIQGIGKGMQANLLQLFKEGRIEAHTELLKKYRPSMLELLKIQGSRAKDDCLDLERLSGQRSGRRGEIGTRRQDPRTAAHGREARTEAAQGDRRLSPHCWTIPARYRRSSWPKN